MLEAVGLLVVVLLVFQTVTTYLRRSKAKCPPGPVPLPLLGNIHNLSSLPHLDLTEMVKTYGKVYQIYLGSKRVIVVNDGGVAKEILLKKGADFAGRPYVYSGEIYSVNGKAIGFADYSPILKLQRKICIKAMQMVSQAEEVICREVSAMAKIMAETKGTPYNPHFHIGLVVVNVLCGIGFGTHYSLDDQEFVDIVKMNDAFAETLAGNPADIFPWLKIIQTKNIERLKKAVKFRKSLTSRHYEAHIKTYDENNIRDLVDALIKASNEAHLEDPVLAKEITEDHIKEAVADTFVSGAETTTTVIGWVILYLLRHPEIQTKIHQELDRVIGPNRLPGLSDRKDLNYLEAVITETMRISSVAPLGVPHKTTTDTNIGEYPIPKGTTVVINTWAIHHDPDVWKDPQSFDPDRFLDVNGNIITSATTNGFVPFSFGRRACIGEKMARNILFLFLAQLLHEFRFENPKGRDVPSEEHKNGIVLTPAHPYEVCTIKRQ